MIDKMKIYKDTEISNKAVLVYLYLCDRANKKDRSCFPSMKTIARDLNLSLSTVKRAIEELLKRGYIQKENRFRENGGKTSNKYFILWKSRRYRNLTDERNFRQDKCAYGKDYAIGILGQRMLTIHVNSYIVTENKYIF